jgi:hypothetical protein
MYRKATFYFDENAPRGFGPICFWALSSIGPKQQKSIIWPFSNSAKRSTTVVTVFEAFTVGMSGTTNNW